MPSFVNIGAHVGEGTMVDTWATVGSCAQIGRNVHISGGTGIGGVLEPLQAGPVIIEDDCFIGARSEVAEGVIVEQGAVLSMGVFLGASTKIVDRATGEVIYGRVPAYSVVVPGTLPARTAARRSPARSSSSASTSAPAPRPASTSCCATEISPAYRPETALLLAAQSARIARTPANGTATIMFDSKLRDAPAPAAGYAQPMIRTVMNRSDWAILLVLARHLGRRLHVHRRRRAATSRR